MKYVIIWGENMELSTTNQNYKLIPKESFTSKS